MKSPRSRMAAVLLFGALAAAWTLAKQPAGGAAYTVSMLALPGAGPDGIAMDYLGYDPVTNTV